MPIIDANIAGAICCTIYIGVLILGSCLSEDRVVGALIGFIVGTCFMALFAIATGFVTIPYICDPIHYFHIENTTLIYNTPMFESCVR